MIKKAALTVVLTAMLNVALAGQSDNLIVFTLILEDQKQLALLKHELPIDVYKSDKKGHTDKFKKSGFSQFGGNDASYHFVTAGSCYLAYSAKTKEGHTKYYLDNSIESHEKLDSKVAEKKGHGYGIEYSGCNIELASVPDPLVINEKKEKSAGSSPKLEGANLVSSNKQNSLIGATGNNKPTNMSGEHKGAGSTTSSSEKAPSKTPGYSSLVDDATKLSKNGGGFAGLMSDLEELNNNNKGFESLVNDLEHSSLSKGKYECAGGGEFTVKRGKNNNYFIKGPHGSGPMNLSKLSQDGDDHSVLQSVYSTVSDKVALVCDSSGSTISKESIKGIIDNYLHSLIHKHNCYAGENKYTPKCKTLLRRKSSYAGVRG